MQDGQECALDIKPNRRPARATPVTRAVSVRPITARNQIGADQADADRLGLPAGVRVNTGRRSL
jgi:hypothetical protein